MLYLLGYAAGLFIISGMLSQKLWKIKSLVGAGALLFVIYGAIGGDGPIVALNTACVAVAAWELFKLWRASKRRTNEV